MINISDIKTELPAELSRLLINKEDDRTAINKWLVNNVVEETQEKLLIKWTMPDEIIEIRAATTYFLVYRNNKITNTFKVANVKRMYKPFIDALDLVDRTIAFDILQEDTKSDVIEQVEEIKTTENVKQIRTLEEIMQDLRNYSDNTYLIQKDYVAIDGMIDKLENIKPTMVTIPFDYVSDGNKFAVIMYFYDSYYDTAQDTEDFAKEFYNVTYAINRNELPIKLDKLVDYQENLRDLLNNLELNTCW